MRIALGTDHAGHTTKEAVKRRLLALGHEVRDFGCYGPAPCDYPDYVIPAAEAVARGECDRAVVCGGSGNGEAIAANKVRGVRAGLCWSPDSARLNRLHNDGNVLSLGERLVPVELVQEILEVWLSTPFEGGRHAGRIAKLDRYEAASREAWLATARRRSHAPIPPRGTSRRAGTSPRSPA
jgi:ribose 5-phosphate isomerase B